MVQLDLGPHDSLAIEAVADVLANFHDWSASDLESEFRTTLLESFPELEEGFLKGVYRSFMDLDAQTRFGREFDHLGFVRERYQAFNEKADII